ncbi:thioredoxin-like protein [Pontibacter ummariensis]|uniref:Thioredoxin n=1 Tax=Pontibacter ummariensis TaxID=1610492 RepID=A0A239LHI8_9BACT|nr:thioredoxin family protein [Pontibacter ummariensis]PRY03370.1 thioredoxin-like protein [Pontibacter ummariensis]SNT29382.1 Thioredoxin [Pontibacter ummariensis]
MKTLSVLEPTLLNPLTYDAYLTLVEDLVSEQRTTGEEPTAQQVANTQDNLKRMKQMEKQFLLLPGLRNMLQQHHLNWEWLVLTEAWCGDGAQLVPAIAAIARAVPSIKLTILLRDQNPELMETCLTKGTRSIPKLICMDASTGERLFTWGPRPTIIQNLFLKHRAAHPRMSIEELVQQLHKWYAQDRGLSLQLDLYRLAEQALIRNESCLQAAV